MKRSKSSRRWLDEHVNDPYVKRAQKDGLRSRASYKLIELNEKDKLIRPGMLVMDLGSAPGGWSQVAGGLVGEKGRVLASDILPMDPLDNVDFIQGDFTDDAVFQQILDKLNGSQPDLIISDLAPNISGVAAACVHPRAARRRRLAGEPQADQPPRHAAVAAVQHADDDLLADVAPF